MRINCDMAKVSKSWGASTITLIEYADGGMSKRVVLMIDNPSTVSYLRYQLDQIVEGWKSDMRTIGVT